MYVGTLTMGQETWLAKLEASMPGSQIVACDVVEISDLWMPAEKVSTARRRLLELYFDANGWRRWRDLSYPGQVNQGVALSSKQALRTYDDVVVTFLPEE
ncbi:hypothetical protein GY24_04140 [Microterricola pindariensis]|uniref:Uncharacterized protein n=2 Tax=Microterricola pindariensis TaxID=478010 RepID=A0ABX5AZ69_9MICO|nr:hypothetical protein GY24_04140 [Microterricola pindariensis]